MIVDWVRVEGLLPWKKELKRFKRCDRNDKPLWSVGSRGWRRCIGWRLGGIGWMVVPFTGIWNTGRKVLFAFVLVSRGWVFTFWMYWVGGLCERFNWRCLGSRNRPGAQENLECRWLGSNLMVVEGIHELVQGKRLGWDGNHTLTEALD